MVFQGEILIALRQLNEQLTRDELLFLEQHSQQFAAFKNVEFLELTEEQ